MPTIELHGFLDDKNSKGEDSGLSTVVKDVEDFLNLASDTEFKIYDALKDTDFADEVVMSTLFSAVCDFNEKTRPFLRVWATSRETADEIVKRLDPLDIDIEVAPLLLKFVPKRSAREPEVREPSAARPDMSRAEPEGDPIYGPTGSASMENPS